MPPPIKLYTTASCPFCVRAKDLLEKKELSYEEIDVTNDDEARTKMVALSKRRTVPQIWIGERHVGGCDELYALDTSGELDTLLKD